MLPNASGLNPNLERLALRAAKLHETSRIVGLVNTAYRGESSKLGWTTEADLLDGQRTDHEEVAALIAREDSMIVLAEWKEEFVASAHLETHQQGAYLGMLAVTPHLQGLGIGKRLMAGCEDLARERWRAEKMVMTVITLRHDVIAFYERHGYRRTGRFVPFPGSERFGIQKVHGLLLEILEKPLADSNGPSA